MQMIYILISCVTLANHLSFQRVMLISFKEPTENTKMAARSVWHYNSSLWVCENINVTLTKTATTLKQCRSMQREEAEHPVGGF